MDLKIAWLFKTTSNKRIALFLISLEYQNNYACYGFDEYMNSVWYRFMLYSVILTVIRIIIRSLLTHARTITQNTFKPLDFALNMAWEDCFSCPFDIICKDFTNVKIAISMETLLFIQLSASKTGEVYSM